MNILITGATGLIGRKLTNDLLLNGYAVNYLTTRKSQIKSNSKINGYYWNPEKNIIDLECFKNVDTIINLAGSNIAKRWSDSNKLDILNSRIKSLNLLKHSISNNKINIKKIISASAIGIYPSSVDNVYKENESLISDSFLGKVVCQWESAVNSFKDLEIDVVIVNQWQSWIHFQDISNIFYHILKYDLSGVFNGVSPNPVTNKTFTKKIAKFLNRPLLLPNLKKWMMRLLLGEMHTIIFESQNVSCEKLTKSKFKFKFDNFDQAIADLLK
jgi:NAD dependent epimerase/dehydratase family enzyme